MTPEKLAEAFHAELLIRMREIIPDRWGAYADAARRFGVAQSTVRQYMTGAHAPPAWFLAHVAVVAGVSLEWLLLGVGPKYRHQSAEGLAREILLLPPPAQAAIAAAVAQLRALRPNGSEGGSADLQ